MTDPEAKPAASTVESNIRCVADLEKKFEEKRSFVDRVADLIGGFSGSFSFVALHVIWFIVWFLINTGVVPIFPRFDPYPFIPPGNDCVG